MVIYLEEYLSRRRKSVDLRARYLAAAGGGACASIAWSACAEQPHPEFDTDLAPDLSGLYAEATLI